MSDSLLSIPLRRQRVEIPEAGEGQYVIVQELTGAQRDEYDASLIEQRGVGKKMRLALDHATAKLVVLSCINEDGSRRFGDDMVTTVSKMPARVLGRIAAAAKDLSGITDSEIEELTETKK